MLYFHRSLCPFEILFKRLVTPSRQTKFPITSYPPLLSSANFAYFKTHRKLSNENRRNGLFKTTNALSIGLSDMRMTLSSNFPIQFLQVSNSCPIINSQSFGSYQSVHTRLFSNSTEEKSSKQKSSAPLIEDEDKLTLFQKFKSMYKKYWYVLIPVHCVTSVVWFGGFYYAAKNGIDLVPYLEKLSVPDKFLSFLRDSNTGYYAIAYGFYKIATPARYTVTLAGTTLSINYLMNRGYIKPVGELKTIIEHQKDEMIERYQETKEELMDRREEFHKKLELHKEKLEKEKEELREKYQDAKEELMDKYQELKSKTQNPKGGKIEETPKEPKR